MAAWVAPVIAGAAGLLGGILSSKGQSSQAKSQNAFMRWLYDPNRISGAFSQLNPWAYQAMQSPGFGRSLQQIGENPGYIDPSLQSYAFMQNDRTGQSAIQRLQAMIGRSGASGGVSSAHMLGALGMTNIGRGRLAQQFALWREQQKRNDISMLMGQMQNAQGLAAGLAANQGQSYQQPAPWQTTAGNAITSGLAAWGTLGGQNGQQTQTQTPTAGYTGMGPPITANNWLNWKG